VLCLSSLPFIHLKNQKSKEIGKLSFWLFFFVRLEYKKYLNAIDKENTFTADVMPA